MDFQWCRKTQGRIQVLMQLNQAKSVLRFVHDSQLHVATQLFVGHLGKILGNKGDCVWILQRHANPNSCRNNSIAEDPSASGPACLCPSSQSSARSSQATHAIADVLLSSPVCLALSLRDVQVLRVVLFSTTECVDAVRGPTCPRTHCRKKRSHDSSTTTALKMIEQLTLSKARVSCSHQEWLNLVRSGAVMTSET